MDNPPRLRPHFGPSAVAALLAISSVALPLYADAPTTKPVTVTAEDADGIYEIGETIRWTITAQPGQSVRYTVKRGQHEELAAGDLALENKSTVVTAKLDAPGTLLLSVQATDANGKVSRAYGGAAAKIDDIKPAIEPPADFDAFWKTKIDELNAVPMNLQIDPSPTTQPIDPRVKYEKLTLDNIRGTKVRAQLAKPAEGEKFPALVVVQWAGVYPLQKAWAVDRAKEGWLVINVLPHDLPIDEPAEFYAQQRDGALKNYFQIGNDDRDTSYFLRMYLSGYRAADYLMSRPEWDGKNLVVMGTSQGGMQSLMLAGLHPKITGALSLVPAGCDFLGEEVGRRSGWPQWVAEQSKGKDASKVREAARYYDVVNFAPRIKCPTLVGAGLLDTTCPPEGIFAAFNQISAPKELVVMPLSDHQGAGGFQKAYHDRSDAAWLPALRKGETPAGAK